MAARVLPIVASAAALCASLSTAASAAALAAASAGKLVAPYVPPLREGDALPDASFVDERGRRFAWADFRRQTLVLSFAYAGCGDRRMCPLVSAKFARLSHLVAQEPVHLAVVTLDPAADTPQVLAGYAARFGGDPAHLSFATGEPAAVVRLAERFGIRRTGPGGGLHDDAVAIVAPGGRIAKIVEGNDWTVAQVLAEARAALGAPVSSIVRLRLWLASGVATACGGGRSGLSMAAALAVFAGVLGVATVVARRLFGSLFA